MNLPAYQNELRQAAEEYAEGTRLATAEYQRQMTDLAKGYEDRTMKAHHAFADDGTDLVTRGTGDETETLSRRQR